MATFALRIEYLTGTAVSTLPTDRRQPEWPPHPFRLMAALIASLYGTDLGEAGRACLQALEALPPPSIKVAVNAGRRALATTYVPTNDGTAADGLLPSVRFRAARHFPAAIPADPVVYMIWDDIDGRFRPPPHARPPGGGGSLPRALVVPGRGFAEPRPARAEPGAG